MLESGVEDENFHRDRDLARFGERGGCATALPLLPAAAAAGLSATAAGLSAAAAATGVSTGAAAAAGVSAAAAAVLPAAAAVAVHRTGAVLRAAVWAAAPAA